jgi:transposase
MAFIEAGPSPFLRVGGLPVTGMCSTSTDLISEGVQKDEKLPIEKRRKRKKPNESQQRRSMMCICSRERRVYPSDVTDKEWAILEPLIPAAKPGGRPQEIARREIVNGILYVLRSGCPWRMLPHDLPNWSTVHLYFREWKLAGIWEQVNAALRREVRVGAFARS